MRFEFLNVCNDVTKTATKIPQSEYLSKGLYPIYDQGKDVVGGYSNRNDGIANDYPYICFGDHTRVIKYIDSPCFIGADGVKLLKVMNNNFLPKYVYYSMVANPVDSQGYSRHYKLLKETTINYVDRVIQSKIIDELDNLNNIIRTKKDELLLHDELIKSRFIEMFRKYNKVELHTISKITMGQSPDSSSYNDEGNGTPFFQGKGDYGDKYTVVKHYTTSPKKIAKKDSVLMSVRAPVGPVNIANTDCCIGRGLCSIDAIEGQTNNEFIYNALNAMQDEISGKGNGSTFKAINKDDVYKLQIPSAPIDEQNDFSNFVKLIDKSKFIVQKEIKDLQELLDKKMDEYFG